MFGIGQFELMILFGIALLLFGSRLPQVARSMGKSLSEFKQGMQGVQDEFNSAMDEGKNATSIDYSDPSYDDSVYDDESEQPPAAPKFEPPKAPPVAEQAAVAEETTADK